MTELRQRMIEDLAATDEAVPNENRMAGAWPVSVTRDLVFDPE